MNRFGMAVSAFAVCALTTAVWSGEKAEQPLDKAFLAKMAHVNHHEIEVSMLAKQRATSPHVKEYAAMMIHDHKEANEKLAGLIKVQKSTAPGEKEGQEGKDHIAKLSKLQGAEFDHAYLEAMIKGHKKVLPIIEGQLKNGQDTMASSYAKEVLPTVRMHLAKAQELVGNK